MSREELKQELKREILSEWAGQDFVHVILCKNCDHFHETAVGWCNLKDEPKAGAGFCSDARPKKTEE